MNDLTQARVDALTIAISLMERHLEAATPGGAGQESVAYQTAIGRVETLRDLRASLAEDEAVALDAAASLADPRRVLPEGARVETIFEIRTQGDLNGAQRAMLTTAFLRTVSKTTGVEAMVIGHQEVIGPEDPPAMEAPAP